MINKNKDDQCAGQRRRQVEPDLFQKIEQRNLKINLIVMNAHGVDRRPETNPGGDRNHENGLDLGRIPDDVRHPAIALGIRHVPNVLLAVTRSRSIGLDLKKMFIVKLKMSKHLYFLFTLL